MITFKTFLEAVAKGSKEPQFQDLTVDEAVKMLNTHCKNALWMLEENTPLYRGHKGGFPNMRGTDYFRTVDTSLTTRKSQNTNNAYTAILDNTPSMKEFPKRSKSFVCAVGKGRASVFGAYDNDNDTFIMIPFDDAKIGITNANDLWDINIRLFGCNFDIHFVNRLWEKILKKYNLDDDEISYNSFIQLSKLAEEDKEKFINDVCDAAPYIQIQHVRDALANTTLLDYIDDVYSPHRTFMTWGYSNSDNVKKTLLSYRESEMWVSGKIIVISLSMWDKLRNVYSENEKVK